MRPRELSLIASALVAFAADARADDCLDASDRARRELQAGRLLAARAALHACAAPSCEETVRALCEERLGEVAERISSVVFDVKDGDGNDLADVLVSVDGKDVTKPPGVALALDPGAHTFRFQHAGRVETRSFVLLEREKDRRERIVFARPHGTEMARPTAPLAEPPPPDGPWRSIGAITVAAGAVGIGIGAAFGITALDKNATADCDASNVCGDPRSRHDARVAANISTASFVTGGVLAIVGVALYLLAPRPNARR